MMRVARWGNALAVRIPANVARSLKLVEGDQIELRALDDHILGIGKDEQRRRAIEAMRTIAWELPADYKFDREEANTR